MAACAVRFVSDVVGNPKDKFSYNEAHILISGGTKAESLLFKRLEASFSIKAKVNQREINSTLLRMELSKVVKKLHRIASPSLAGSWDNVGLLVEPSAPHTVRTILLTNDLTPPVLQEAIEKKSDLIISYHPPIFSPLKRLTQKKWKEELIVRCIENRIAVFSPHTSYDCVEDGVNDWLISCFGMYQNESIRAHFGH